MRTGDTLHPLTNLDDLPIGIILKSNCYLIRLPNGNWAIAGEKQFLLTANPLAYIDGPLIIYYLPNKDDVPISQKRKIYLESQDEKCKRYEEQFREWLR